MEAQQDAIQATFYEDQLSDGVINTLRMFLDDNIYLSEKDSIDLADSLYRAICEETDEFTGKIFLEMVLRPRLRKYIEH